MVRVFDFSGSCDPQLLDPEPEDFKKDLLKDVKEWVKRQEGKVTLV